MPRLLAIDYGLKRTGLAVTDPLQIIATSLDAVETDKLMDYLKNYLQKEPVEAFVIGLPLALNGQETEHSVQVRKFARQLEQTFAKPIHWIDERFTSKMAFQALVQSGVPKKERRIKENTDKISAVIILQSYLKNQKK